MGKTCDCKGPRIGRDSRQSSKIESRLMGVPQNTTPPARIRHKEPFSPLEAAACAALLEERLPLGRGWMCRAVLIRPLLNAGFGWSAQLAIGGAAYG